MKIADLKSAVISNHWISQIRSNQRKSKEVDRFLFQHKRNRKAEEMQQQQDMYEGKMKATIKEATADQVWPLIADFCGIHRWMPSVDARLDGGVAGVVGCIRYSTLKNLSPVNGESIGWERERLTSIDHASRKLSYVVVDNGRR
ncbi:hypothetical protein EJ110_NYTH15393 [Nymphaea thermarum]|nr:hypothetical protein EJ110_NYTH15393 [Nymphaea thermarum]